MRSLVRSCLSPALAACLFTGLIITVSAPPVRAAGNYDARIMLHALTQTTKNPCTRVANMPSDCNGYSAGTRIVTLYPPAVFVYALVVNGSQAEGIGGAAFGINYDPVLLSGVDVYSWTSCGNSELPAAGWPEPGGGNTISFTTPGNCQTSGNGLIGAVAALGYFYCAAYTPGRISITAHPVTHGATVTNCAGAIDFIRNSTENCTHLGTVGFGMNGNNPCGREDFHGTCSPSCAVSGPTEVNSGETGIEYSAVPGEGQLTWSIVGNGTFEGPTADQLTVHVTAGAQGQYTVRATFSGMPFPSHACEITSTVNDPVASVPVTWTHLKALMSSGE